MQIMRNEGNSRDGDTVTMFKMKTLIPLSFEIPLFKSATFELGPISATDIDADYHLVLKNKDFIERTAGTTFPNNFTKTEDLIDLSWHQREFEFRGSFAYKIIEKASGQYVGCLYIYGSDKTFVYKRLPKDFLPFDAVVNWWFAETYFNSLCDIFSLEAYEWITQEWPFRQVYFTNKHLPDTVLKYWSKDNE